MGKCLPSKMPFGRPDQIFSRLRLGPRDEREAVRMCLKTPLRPTRFWVR